MTVYCLCPGTLHGFVLAAIASVAGPLAEAAAIHSHRPFMVPDVPQSVLPSVLPPHLPLQYWFLTPLIGVIAGSLLMKQVRAPLLPLLRRIKPALDRKTHQHVIGRGSLPSRSP